MELDIPTFKKIEAVGWTFCLCFLFFFCGNFFIYCGLCAVVRKLYMIFKTKNLGLLDTKGKVVVVTGCDSGFGLAAAKHLYEKGFTVYAACLNPDSDGGKSLKALGSGKLKVVPLDVTSDDSVAQCLTVVKKECSRSGLWGLVNNAGLFFVGDAELTKMEQHLNIVDINMFGMVRTCRAFLPLLRQAKGRVVNVTSCRGLVAVPSSPAYTMAKFGAEAFSETLRLETSQSGVTVSTVEPCSFGNATGCQNDAGRRRIKADMDEMWRDANEDVKKYYGSAHLTKQFEILDEDAKKTTPPSVQPVVDAFEDALRNPCPQVRYLIRRQRGIFDLDLYYVLSLLVPYLPQTLFDKFRDYFVPYTIYK